MCNTASVAGRNMAGSSMAYGASKAGLDQPEKNLARALAPNVRVNAVAPGFVDTDWTRRWPAARKQASIERTLLRRACTPVEIATAIVFLCADATMVTAKLWSWTAVIRSRRAPNSEFDPYPPKYLPFVIWITGYGRRMARV